MVDRYHAMPRDKMVNTSNGDAQHAFEAGGAAFRAIAGGLSDHYREGKSRPRPPKCPYRIATKRQAWQRGYESAHDEFMADLLVRD